jgi:hypothetical protein
MRLAWQDGQGANDGEYVRLSVCTTVKAGFVTGSAGAGGVGKRESKTLSDENGSGVPSSSYLE